MIKILNIKYSRNTGDGVIAECLENKSSFYYGGTITSVDLSGKSGFATDGSKLGMGFYIYNFLDLLPNTVSSFLINRVLPKIAFSKLERVFRKELQNCKVLIIGGGQLIQDKKMYFPPRMKLALDCLPSDSKIYFYSVGVAKDWSEDGVSYMQDVFNDYRINRIYVRDPESRNNLIRNFDVKEDKILVALDPGLLAGEVFKYKYERANSNCKAQGKKIIGLGVSAPSEIAAHVSSNVYGLILDVEQYIDIVSFLNKNFEVRLFTNGSDSDELLKEQIHKKLSEIGLNIKKYHRPMNPSDLAKIISELDIVLSHRLHACIVGFSMNKTILGFSWDSKLNSFFEIVNLPENVLSNIDYNSIESFILKSNEYSNSEAYSKGVNLVTNEAENSIKHLIESIKNAK